MLEDDGVGEGPDADDDDEEAVFAETGVNKLSRLVFAVLLSDAPLLADTAEPGSPAGAGGEAELDEELDDEPALARIDVVEAVDPDAVVLVELCCSCSSWKRVRGGRRRGSLNRW